MGEYKLKGRKNDMETRGAILKEVKYIALGCAVGTAIMIAVFAVIGKFDISVLLGGIYGCVLVVLNFLILGLTVHKLANQAVENRNAETSEVDPAVINAAKLKMHASYLTRMIAGAGLLIVAIAVFKLNWIACMIPMLFPRIVIMIRQYGLKAGNIKGSGIK